MYSRKYIKERKNITRKKKYGGKTIESGGYGCIFQPPLKCKNNNPISNTYDNYVTKLMLKQYAEREFDEIKKYQRLLQNIPNYENYFLINDFSTCIPKEISKNDLVDFNEKCRALEKNDYNEKNINDKLNDLKGINMPYGGIDIHDYIHKIRFNIRKMKILNKTLIELLKNGIIRMNQQHVYHGDIKESNVLVLEQHNDLQTRLIDWGLSTTYNNEDKIPNSFRSRPFQYNLPFSSVLLSSSFKKACDLFLKKRPKPSRSDIRSFTVNYILHIIKHYNSNHLKHIHNTFKSLFKHEIFNMSNDETSDVLEYNYSYENIFDYITQILEKYIKNNKFHVMEYFKQVYLKNVDIWGFVTIYLYFVEYISYKNKKHRIKHYKKNQLKLIDKIKEAYLLLLNSPDKPIDIDTLVIILNQIDPLLNNSLSEEFKNKNNTIIKFFDFLDNVKQHQDNNSDYTNTKVSNEYFLKKNTRKNKTKKIIHNK